MFGFGIQLNKLKQFKGLLNRYTGATAAYSLRKLSSTYHGPVVKVRRGSDDTEADFTYLDVSDGTLQAWVNTDVDKLDLQTETGSLVGNVTNETATGFDFSVNNEGSVGVKRLLPVPNTTVGTYNATFDVVVNSGSLSGITLTRVSNNNQIVAGSNSINLTLTPTTLSGAIYFRTNETAVADVSITNITLTQTSADGHVSTWYDQSGNTNHATQATAASQPKIVDAGALLTDGIDFDGTDDWLKSSNSGAFQSSDGVGFFSVYKKKTVSTSDVFSGVNPQYLMLVRDTSLSDTTFAARILGGKLNVIRANEAGSNFFTTIASTHTIGNNTTLSSVVGLQSVNLFNDGTELSLSTDESGVTYDIADSSILLGTQDGGTRFLEGFISEIIIYNSDQSAKRVAIEDNIASHYDITI